MFCFLLALPLILFSPLQSFANDPILPPPAFNHWGKTLVFVDFVSAHYQIDYDLLQNKTQVVSKINFLQEKNGFPIFDLVASPQKILVDGKVVAQFEVSDPHSQTKFRYANKELEEGEHTLEIYHQLSEGVIYPKKAKEGVRSGFFMSDLSDRQFLERFLPASFEYDQVEMTFEIIFTGNLSPQTIMTNGEIEEKAFSKIIRFPATFNASSIYFHTFPTGTYAQENFKLESHLTPGRIVPISLYTLNHGDLAPFKKELIKTFHELEQTFGSWPHPSLIVYGAGRGGMEYCGATITSLSALGHEMTHSYFARGVMPKNGNAGWFDEAVASWRGKGYPRHGNLSYKSGNLGGHSPYRRTTDRLAYTRGTELLGYLDYKLQGTGGLKPFLAHLKGQREHQLIDNSLLEKDLSLFFSQSFEQIFKKFIYSPQSSEEQEENFEENPYHPHLTYDEWKNLL